MGAVEDLPQAASARTAAHEPITCGNRASFRIQLILGTLAATVKVRMPVPSC